MRARDWVQVKSKLARRELSIVNRLAAMKKDSPERATFLQQLMELQDVRRSICNWVHR